MRLLSLLSAGQWQQFFTGKKYLLKSKTPTADIWFF
jgi:hypothetical protein